LPRAAWMRRRSRPTASRSKRRWRRTTRSRRRPRPMRSRSCSKVHRPGSTGAQRRSPLSVAMRDGGSARAADVILRDGATLRLRAPAAEDAGALTAFFGAMSDRSLYLRFHGVKRIDDALVQHFLEPNWENRGVLVGELDGRIVAVGEYARLRDESAAEAAFAVADEHQGRGIGTRLLEQLAQRASEVGIERFVAEVMPENRAMIGVFEGTGLEVTRELEGGEFEIRFPIVPTEQYRARVDERDHLAVTASLRPFFEPGSVA